jgi:peptidoglycan/xylan/chitin deacetylase (PgdA/CDA1 family)
LIQCLAISSRRQIQTPSLNTRRLLVEEGGFLYDSDCYNDELPYWVEVSTRSHLVVPYTLSVNDSKYTRAIFGTSDVAFLNEQPPRVQARTMAAIPTKWPGAEALVQ